jgi:hypothetical protein
LTTPQDSDALQAAKGLTGALTDMTDQLKKVADYGQESRKMIWALAVSLTLDLILTIVVAFFAIEAHDADTSATAARQIAAVAQHDNLNLCLSSNVARAQQVGLWDYLFNLAGPARTAEGAKLDAEFKHHLQVVFAPRDCAKVDPSKS